MAGGGPLLRCVVGLSPIPAFAACLRAYDVEGAGLPLEAWSLDVAGAVVCGVSGGVTCVRRGGAGVAVGAAVAAAAGAARVQAAATLCPLYLWAALRAAVRAPLCAF